MANFLLTHWTECDKDRWDLNEGELSVEAKTFKVNPNSRDMKGWNCCCIAVFHSSLKVLKLLLQNGGNPSARSMYNKNAHDLAKDELDAANNVVTSRAEIRDVIAEYDTVSPQTKSTLFGVTTASAKNDKGMDYSELGPDGSPIAMQIEMNNEMMTKDKDKVKKDTKGGASGGKGKKKPIGATKKKK